MSRKLNRKQRRKLKLAPKKERFTAVLRRFFAEKRLEALRIEEPE